jgi:hypothetical protein
MNADQLRQAHRASPFRPFLIRMMDGRLFFVPHPDYFHVFPSGRTAKIVDHTGGAGLIDIAQVKDIEVSTGSTT